MATQIIRPILPNTLLPLIQGITSVGKYCQLPLKITGLNKFESLLYRLDNKCPNLLVNDVI